MWSSSSWNLELIPAGLYRLNCGRFVYRTGVESTQWSAVLHAVDACGSPCRVADANNFNTNNYTDPFLDTSGSYICSGDRCRTDPWHPAIDAGADASPARARRQGKVIMLVVECWHTKQL